MKKEVLNKASRLSLQDYESSETYDMMQRAENQTEGGIVTYFDTVMSIVGTLVTCVSYIIKKGMALGGFGKRNQFKL